MNSHKYAEELKAVAAFLLSKPDVPVGYSEDHVPSIYLSYSSDKERFLEAARAFGSGQKSYDEWNLNFTPKGCLLLKMMVSRSAVCRKVQEEKWECEPLLSDEEESSIAERP
jgi:hypothetical protein